MRRLTDDGSVTAEAAVLLPLLVVVLLVGAGVVHAYRVELQVQDAAKVAARAAARGESAAEVRRLAAEAGPPGVEVRVRTESGLVRVEATATVDPLGAAVAVVPGMTVRAMAVAADEQVQIP